MKSGMLSAETVLAGYAHGIFPMAEYRHGPIGWYAPERRAIIPLDAFHVPRNTRRLVKQGAFDVRADVRFDDVIARCADRDETWISPAIEDAYRELHRRGFAHSVESWVDDALVGGLYGVSLGGAFFGESMFHTKSGASDVALVHLVEHLITCRFTLLDIQFINPHLERYGAVEIPRTVFESMLGDALFSGSRWLPFSVPEAIDP